MIDYNKLFGVEDSYQAPEKIMSILFDKDEREKLFMKLLQANDFKIDFDWFFEYFQDEHADRKNKKQDFTPECVCDLLSKLISTGEGNDGNYYECAAGTGGIMIKHWYNHRNKYSIFDYEPCFHFAWVEELSDRCIPFLLLNMMIRGMNGIVIHGDCITRKCKNAYFICNTKNDYMGFSGISVIPHTELMEKELNVKWLSEEYVDHLELMTFEEMEEILDLNISDLCLSDEELANSGAFDIEIEE